MNKPNAMPKWPQFSTPSDVSAGLHKLPGASCFVKPSIKTTTIINNVEMMPSIDAYERRDNGRKTVGINLEIVKVQCMKKDDN
jgi:hypothetical protein